MGNKVRKPKLKSIESVVGIGGKTLIRDYLTRVFKAIGFEKYNKDTFPAFVNYKGYIDDKEMKIAISLLKNTRYIGLNTDQLIRYRTFQGLRLQVRVKIKTQTRLTIARKVNNKFGLKISNFIIKLKKFKIGDTDYLGKTVIYADKPFAKAFVSDRKIKNLLKALSNTEIISWGMVIIPEKLDIGFTFRNLDCFEEVLLQERLSNIAKLADLINQKPISKIIKLTKHEVMARDNPKALAWRYLLYLLIYIVAGTGLLIAILFGLAKLIGMI